jgi:hypothetical protein
LKFRPRRARVLGVSSDIEEKQPGLEFWLWGAGVLGVAHIADQEAGLEFWLWRPGVLGEAHIAEQEPGLEIWLRGPGVSGVAWDIGDQQIWGRLHGRVQDAGSDSGS